MVRINFEGRNSTQAASNVTVYSVLSIEHRRASRTETCWLQGLLYLHNINGFITIWVTHIWSKYCPRYLDTRIHNTMLWYGYMRFKLLLSCPSSPLLLVLLPPTPSYSLSPQQTEALAQAPCSSSSHLPTQHPICLTISICLE